MSDRQGPHGGRPKEKEEKKEEKKPTKKGSK